MGTSQDLPDLIAYAQTASEALENAKDSAQQVVDSYLEHGDPLAWDVRKLERVHSEMIAVAVNG